MAMNRSTRSLPSYDSIETLLNEGILMTSIDSLPETDGIFLDDSSHPVIKMDPTVEQKETVTEISKIWSPEEYAKNIKALGQILSHTTDDCKSKLCESIEELTTSSIEKSILWPSLTTLQKSFVKCNGDATKNNDDLIDDLHKMYNEDPHNFTEHLITIIEETSDLSISVSSKTSFEIHDASDSLDSTKYMNLHNFDEKSENNTSVVINESPINLASIQRRMYAVGTPKNLSTGLRSGTTRFCETPEIIVTPGTPQICDDTIQLPHSEGDEDNYVTAESDDNDSEDTTIVEPETSKNETLNMSKVASRHQEWVEIFDKVSRYHPINKKITNYKSHLEKRWFRELAKKRQKCFDSVNNLLEKAAAKNAQECDENSECVCHYCKRQMEFLNTIVACSEYYCYATNQNSARNRSINIEKKKYSSPSQLGVMSVKANVSNSYGQNLTKKVPKKMSGKKVRSINRKFNSPRRSIVTKSISRGSPRHNIKPTSGIDTTSIRPVSALRAIFSPNTKISGSKRSSNMISKLAGSKTDTSKLIVLPSMSKMYSSPTSTIATTRIRFQHVKSPVGEYIKGNKH